MAGAGRCRSDICASSLPLGTAGAITLLDPRPELPFVVSNGDVLTDIHYGELLEFHCRHGAAATMAVRQHEWQHPFGVVRTNGIEIVGFDEKPVARTHINAGIYVLEPGCLDALEVGEHCDMPTLFARLQERGAAPSLTRCTSRGSMWGGRMTWSGHIRCSCRRRARTANSRKLSDIREAAMSWEFGPGEASAEDIRERSGFLALPSSAAFST